MTVVFKQPRLAAAVKLIAVGDALYAGEHRAAEFVVLLHIEDIGVCAVSKLSYNKLLDFEFKSAVQ